MNGPTEPGTADDLLRALGRTVQAASRFDVALETLFCALIGSEYAAIVATKQNTSWLCDNCEALIRAHKALAPKHKAKLRARLSEGSNATRKRNQLVHDLWSSRSEGPEFQQLQRQRRKAEWRTESWTLDEINAVERDLTLASIGIGNVLAEFFDERP